MLYYHGFIHGIPKAQPRPRAFVRNGRAAVYDAGTAEGWKSCIASALKELAGRKISLPVKLTITYNMPRPKSHYNSKGQLKLVAPRLFTSKPDLDNLDKAVMDCLTQVGVWTDDSLVVCKQSTKKYACLTGVYITIEDVTI